MRGHQKGSRKGEKEKRSCSSYSRFSRKLYVRTHASPFSFPHITIELGNVWSLTKYTLYMLLWGFHFPHLSAPSINYSINVTPALSFDRILIKRRAVSSDVFNSIFKKDIYRFSSRLIFCEETMYKDRSFIFVIKDDIFSAYE